MFFEQNKHGKSRILVVTPTSVHFAGWPGGGDLPLFDRSGEGRQCSWKKQMSLLLRRLIIYKDRKKGRHKTEELIECFFFIWLSVNGKVLHGLVATAERLFLTSHQVRVLYDMYNNSVHTNEEECIVNKILPSTISTFNYINSLLTFHTSIFIRSVDVHTRHFKLW